MRTLDLRVPCPCAAATFWALREERAWDEACAAADGQRYVPEAVRRVPAPPRGVRVERVSRLEQRWPPALLAALGGVDPKTKLVEGERFVKLLVGWLNDHRDHLRDANDVAKRKRRATMHDTYPRRENAQR